MSEKEATRLLEEAEVLATEERIDASTLELTEQVIQLNRVAKVVKGGRRFSFSALVVVGDSNGHVGVGFGKANEVPESIQKAVQNGKKNLIFVPRVGRTIAYALTGQYAAARVMLRPASEGTGIIAGPAMRAVLELAGIKDVLTKNLGSSNVINILKATIEGLRGVRDAESVARLRGKNLEEMVGGRRAAELRKSSPTWALSLATHKIIDETKRSEEIETSFAAVEEAETPVAPTPEPPVVEQQAPPTTDTPEASAE